MKRFWMGLKIGGLVAVMAVLGVWATGGDGLGRPVAPPAGPVVDLVGLPLAFEPNRGQTDAAVRYLAHAPGGVLYFTADAVVLTLANDSSAECGVRSAEYDAAAPGAHVAAPGPPDVVRVQWVGANTSAPVAGAALSGRVNYLLGADPAGWQTDLPTYGALTYGDLYPGIDLHYSGAMGRLKGTYRVAAGADPGQIRWRYDCGLRIADCGISLAPDGSLQIKTGAAPLTEAAPVAWQEEGGQRTAVAARYALAADGSVGFALGAYDRALPLIIDPTLIYSTFLGGTMDDWAYGVAVDGAGNMYMAGYTSSTNFPTMNAYQPQNAGPFDAYVAKLNPSGTALIYATYLGGNAQDSARGIAVDTAGNVYVAGFTGSATFPVVNAFQPQLRGSYNAFLSKLNPAGSGLVYSTYLGGTNEDEAFGVAVDASGSAYVTGFAYSTDFPTQNPIQGQNGGSTDAFITRFTPAGNALAYSTYLGGSDPDEALGVAVDGSGNAYVAGTTYSANFPVANAYQPVAPSRPDAFVSKVNAAGTALVYSTYLGGTGRDVIGGYENPFTNQSGNVIAVDAAGEAFVTGSTTSLDFPVLNAFQPQHHGLIYEYDAFVTKFSAAGNALVYSTYLGGDGPENGHAIAVDAGGYAVVVGHTQSANFPVVHQLPGLGLGGPDGFVTKFNPDGATVAYSTYLGGNQSDFALAVAVGGANNAYVVGQAQSANFPIVGTPVQATPRGQVDSFLAKIFDPYASPTPTVTGTPPTNTPTQTRTVTRTPTITRSPTRTGTPPTATPTPTPPPGCGPSWSPVPRPGSGGLTAIAATGTNDAWAVGADGVLHWDGVAWSNVRVGNYRDVAAIGPSDVWVLAPGGELAHWNGATWTAYTNPDPTANQSIAASDSTHVWAVGTSGTPPFSTATVVFWNGSAWTRICCTLLSQAGDRPQGGCIDQGTVLFQALARGTGSLWAWGAYTVQCPPDPTITYFPILMTCGPTGCSRADWTTFPVPSTLGQAGGDGWLVGGFSSPVAYHWTGNGWVDESAQVPNIGGLTGVGGTGPGDVWFVGSNGSAHYDGTHWALIETGLVASQVAAGGPNDVWGINGPTIVHYPDFPLFSDVPGANPFYRYVQALACRGLISGYICGGPGEPCDPQQRPYYRPGATVTRGQTAKIVANAAGFADVIPTTQQTFADVPPSNPFWLWVERIAARGIISGYTCGGPGEPCDPTQRPYFRAYNDVTRGQLAKIVSSAANFQDVVPTTQQTFADIPNTNPFWLWIERVAGRGIISGYTCGGPSEPCDPLNRPYFRPGNPSTRAQTAKIVTNAFFSLLTGQGVFISGSH